MSVLDLRNQFLEEARLLSISARFGLATCFLNEFCNRFEIQGLALEEFRQHLWDCPLFSSSSLEFGRWYVLLPPIAKDGISETQAYELSGVSSLSATDLGRLSQILACTFDLLSISFYGAGEDEGTYELLVRISDLARPTEFPATTPFKFSGIEQRDGWGPELVMSDLLFWRKYSENWFRWTSGQGCAN